MHYQSLINRMSLEEKIALCSGADFFSTKAFEKLGIPSISMSDGPHGLRKQIAASDHLGLNKSIPSTSFPTASLSACSWDRELLKEMGAAIGEEAQQEGVSIVLGPGVNIKRNPLCGRNFEYFSEDPFLSGELAAGWIIGIQSQGVGASLKHFAANNQENERMSSDSLVDERTLHEIYLPAFERAVKQAKPATVMCAYNRLNGIFCSDNSYLLRDILRSRWGFEGVIVTDWGALNDRVQAFQAGLDLEMPGSLGCFDQVVRSAVQTGTLPEARIDEAVDRILQLVFAAADRRQHAYRYDMHQHHLLAKKIALQSAVLLKNEGEILPIKKGQRIALIGELAREARYQGAGSSHINPTKLSNIREGLDAVGCDCTFHPGYLLNGKPEPAMLDAAVAAAKDSDVAVIVAGLPASFESEGFDRANMNMPENQNALIARVAAHQPNTVVLLVGGAPVEVPWLPKVRALLNMYLAGQAGGLAAADLLMGLANPSGKLAETYPHCYEDVPSAGFYETGGKQAQYREGIYVGYRYYDVAHKQVLFPFGFGLSYTAFAYHDLTLSHATLQAPHQLDVSLMVSNTGKVDGAEVVQVYVGYPSGKYRVVKKLVEFAKVFLKAGETKQVHFALDASSFSTYSVKSHEWVVESGTYQVMIGASSREIRLQADLTLEGQAAANTYEQLSAWYTHLQGKPTHADFETLLGRQVEPLRPLQKGEYTLECSLQDMRASPLIRLIIKIIQTVIRRGLGKVEADDPTYTLMASSAISTPLKNLSLITPQSMSRRFMSGLVNLANGRFLKIIFNKPQNKEKK